MILDCGREECEEHGDLCAFHGDEPGRCSWCHCAWSAIIDSAYHSCERRDVWPERERDWRVMFARAARIRAERNEMPDRGAFCAHLTPTPN